MGIKHKIQEEHSQNLGMTRYRD